MPSLNFDKKHFEKFCYVKIALLAHSPTCISTHAPCGTSQTGREKAVMVGWVLTEMDAVYLGLWCSVPGGDSEYLNKISINLT